MDYQEIITTATQYVSISMQELSDEYWEAYYWRRGECQKRGRRFDWSAGCRVKETATGGCLEWFVMQPQGKGKKAFFKHMQIHSRHSSQQTEEFSSLQTEEKRIIRAIDAKEKEVRKITGAIANINQRMRWLEKNVTDRKANR
ncbi:hypothetical protein A6K26_007825 [Gammaproteobacteria bacterium 2W06]|nr:hypothetical protein A6K26_007825 [Gammaproteobacteria bacterium 2W06]